MVEAATRSRLKVVVAILTRDRPQMLRRCLASVAASEAPIDADVHVLVVDNGSASVVSDANRRTVGAAVGPFPAGVVVDSRPGIPAARNRALAEAEQMRAAAVVFLDDDQTVPRDWVATLIAVWREEHVDVVKSLVRWAFDSPARLTEHFRARDPCGPRRAPATYQMATNGVLVGRRVWAELGVRFDEGLTYTGGSDTAFFRDALALGASALLTRETSATEHCPAEKQTRRWLLRRAWRVGAVDALQRFKPYSRAGYALRGLAGASGHAVLATAFLWSPERAFAHLLRTTKAAGRVAGAFGIRPDEYRRILGR